MRQDSNLTSLVVEKDRDMCDCLQKIFLKKGYDLTTATNVKEDLERLGEKLNT